MQKEQKPWFSRNKSNLLLSLASIILVIIFLEVINYFLFLGNGRYYVWPPNLNMTFLPNANVIYGVEGDSHFTINSLGYRGPVIENKEKEFRILALGGSTTECLYLDNSETWPYLIMEKLNQTKDERKVVVMNIGKSGHNTRDHILQLKYLLDDYNPDLVIAMVGANDMLFKLSKRWVWKPFNESSYDYKKTFYYVPNYTFKETYSYTIFEIIKNKFFLKVVPQDIAGKNYLESRQQRLEGESWIGEPPDLNPVLRDYEDNLNYLINISNEHNTTILFLTQPFLWKKNMNETEDSALWMATDFNGNFYETEVMIESMEAFNKKLLDVCKDREVLCLDLERQVPKTLEYFYDDMHFNEKGADLVSDKFVKFVKKEFDEF